MKHRSSCVTTVLTPVLCAVSFGALGAHAQDVRITSQTVLAQNGGRVSWNRPANVIAYDAADAEGYFDVYRINPDGSGNSCITCDVAALPPLNKGNPIWNPAGTYLVFQAQQLPSLGTAGDILDRPGSGWNNDLWVTDAAGQNFWKLTNEPAVNGGVIYPTFSWDGTKLAYGERLSPSPNPFGTWHLVVADFVVTNGVPSLQNPQIYQPGDQKFYYEPHGFSADNQTLFFMAYLNPGLSPYAMDIYGLNLSTGDLTDLTNTPHSWDEHPTPFLPNISTSRMLYMSTLNTPAVDGQGFCDYYLMNYDGSNRLQLSYYNDPYAPNYLSTGVCLADPSWNADGTQFAGYANAGHGPAALGASWIFTIEPANPTVSSASFARPPLAMESMITVFGSDFNTQSLFATSLPLPTNLGGTTASITDAAGNTQNVELFFVSPTQINALIPRGTARGPAVMSVTNSAGVQTRATVDVSYVSPAFFTVNSSGAGAAAAYVIRVQTDGTQVFESAYTCPSGITSCTTNPIASNTDQLFLVLFGSGLRHYSSLDNVQVSFSNNAIGTQTAPAQFVGPQGDGSTPGFDQVNVMIPSSLAGAGTLDVAVTVDGVTSNTVQIQMQ